MNARRFAVAPVPKRAYVFVVAMLLLPLLGVAVALLAAPPRPGDGWLALLAALPILAGVALLLLGGMRRRSVEWDGEVLVVRAGFHTHRIARRGLDLSAARIVDLDRERALAPRLKSAGFAVPGFRAGHFRGRPLSRRQFCLLTDYARVLLLPEHDGRTLLLSLEHPRALLQALQETPA